MLDVEQRQSSRRQPNFARWLHQELQEPGILLRVRLKANRLHILCESSTNPQQTKIVPRLVEILNSPTASKQLASIASGHPVYKLVIYGRKTGEQQPEWTRQLPWLASASQSPTSQSNLQEQDSTTSPHHNPARTLPPEERTQSALLEITRYLSNILAHLGVKVKLKIQNLSPNTPNSSEVPRQRLWVICYSEYSPDASLLAEPIAQKLRQLELEGFREAIIRAQVIGEKSPDWSLKVDLTPPGQMLKDWATWGDEQAIGYLLNQNLNPQGIEVEAVRQEVTLHLLCRLLDQSSPANDSLESPEQTLVMESISGVLTALKPQGIEAAAIYGLNGTSNLTTPEPANNLITPATEFPFPLSETPVWIDWLQLNSQVTTSIYTLAQQENQEALIFLLERSLNPDLNWRLATGGIRIKLSHQQDLLHIMTEGVVCPNKSQVVKPIETILRQLSIPTIAGVRIYGRHAGQSTPLWNYGVDFRSRQRSPKSVFKASPAPLANTGTESNLSPSAALDGTLDIPSQDPPAPKEDSKNWFNRALQNLPTLGKLGWAQIFVPNLATQLEEDKTFNWRNSTSDLASGNLSTYHGTKVALIWGMIGLLLTLQTDWLVGKLLYPTLGAMGELSTSDQQQAEVKEQSGELSNSSNAAQVAILAAARSNNPSFDNRILNEKLALYQQHVAEHGAPDILIVGSSRAMRGVDPKIVNQALEAQGDNPLDIFNFGINGATAQVVEVLIRQILSPEQLPKLIIWADGARAFNSSRPDPTYEAIINSAGFQALQSGNFPQLAGGSPPNQLSVPQRLTTSYETGENWLNNSLAEFSFAYNQRQEIKGWLQDNFAQVLDSTPIPAMEQNAQASVGKEESFTMDLDGFLPISQRFNPQTYYQNHPQVPGLYDGDYHNFRLDGKQYDALISLLELIKEQEIKLVFVNTPLTDIYLDSVRSKYEQEFSQYIQQFANNQDLVFIDLAHRWTKQYGLFSDPSHLNRYGAVQVSRQLVQEPGIVWHSH